MKTLILVLISAGLVPLLSYGCLPTAVDSKAQARPPLHRYEDIETGAELNWSYWPDVVGTPVFGE